MPMNSLCVCYKPSFANKRDKAPSMKCKNMSTVIFFAAAMYAFSFITSARATFADTLVIIPDSTTSMADSTHGTYHFGVISRFDKPEISKTFVIKNISPYIVEIARLQPSCGCTTAAIVSSIDPLNSAFHTNDSVHDLPPGATVRIRVTIDDRYLVQGTIYKSVFVYIKGEDQPALNLAVTGSLVTGVAFLPTAIDFGNVPCGQSRSWTVSVRIDQRLFKRGSPPDLIPFCRGVKLQQVVVPKYEMDAATNTRVIVETYDVQFTAESPVGSVLGTLTFLSSGSNTSLLADGASATLTHSVLDVFAKVITK